MCNLGGEHLKKLVFALVSCLLIIPCSAEIIIVDNDWPYDFNNIQAAIDYSNDGDYIIVFPGTYTGSGNRDIDFRGKAITVRSIDPNDPSIVAATVVDCNRGPYDPLFPFFGEPNLSFYFHSGEDTNSIVEGLTIIRGRSGIYCEQSSPKIKNCIISENYCGIVCHSSNAIIAGCKINDSVFCGISCGQGSPVITDCTITGTSGGLEYSGSGIYCAGGSPTIANCLISNNDYSGIYCHDSNATITNCTISNNNNSGIYCKVSEPEITNCTITGNSDSGGIYCDYSSPMIDNCTINGNSAYYDGGGIYCYESSPIISNCKITGNSTDLGHLGRGGGIYGCGGPVTNCTILGNSAISGGGLAECSGPVTNCIIEDNSALEGGGMYLCAAPISNCIIADNSAEYGGGLYGSLECYGPITNCVITGNSASGDGGGIIFFLGPIINCTIANNSAGGSGGGLFRSGYPITNCILWGNIAPTGPQIYNGETSSSYYVNYCDVQGGYPGLGNIDIDPCFVDAGFWDSNGTPNDANDDFWVDGDYHLKSEGWRWDSVRGRWDYDDVTSRCIDAGNHGSPLGDELLSVPDDPNNEWGQNLRIDMGAFGGTAEASIPPYDWALLGDLTNNGIVNLEDFAYQAADWLNSADQQPGDLNRDGLIDIDDLALLIDDWLGQTTWH